MARLVVEDGPDAGREFPLADVAVIGRLKTAQVPLSDASASREHTRVLHQGSDWFLVDLGSRNGTQVNGKSVQRHKLAQGDLIAVGKTVMRFDSDGNTVPAAAPTEEKKEPVKGPSPMEKLSALALARGMPATKAIAKEKKQLSADKPPLATTADGVAVTGAKQAVLVIGAILVALAVMAAAWFAGRIVFGRIIEPSHRPASQRK